LPAHDQLLSAWHAVQAELRGAIGDSQYEIWLADLEPQGWDGHTLTLAAPDATHSWVQGRFGRVLDQAAKTALGTTAEVRLQEDSGPRRSTPAPPAAVGPADGFNPRLSFEQFIIGAGNRLAHAAALAVAELPGQAYNPLFLHAPPGLGKTHLLHAIGNYVTAFGGGAVVRYTTAEAFTNHFVSSLNTRSLEPFKRAYRDADVLLIDDVQFLASKARTIEEFFHTFNALHESGRQLVLTCDRLPRTLVEIEVRLRERFEAGLVADIAPPDLPTRVTILRKRAALDKIPIADPGVFDLIARRVTTNIRALEGALIRVVAFHSLAGRPLDIELATEVLNTMYPARGPRQATITDVQQAVAAHFELSTQELVSPGRTVRLAWPRQLAIHLARELTGASLQTIGEAFGGRNHATVLHACRRVAERLAEDESVSGELDLLSQSLGDQQLDRDC
jgi:chromosomal replication initiator protein